MRQSPQSVSSIQNRLADAFYSTNRADFYGLSKRGRIIFVIFFTPLDYRINPADVSESYPIADRMEESIQQLDAVEGSRYVVFFSYAPGTPSRILSNSQLRTLGHKIARFHQVSSTIELPGERGIFDLDITLFKPLDRLKSAFSPIRKVISGCSKPPIATDHLAPIG